MINISNWLKEIVKDKIKFIAWRMRLITGNKNSFSSTES